LQIKEEWAAYGAALAPLLKGFGDFAQPLQDLIVKLAKVRVL